MAVFFRLVNYNEIFSRNKGEKIFINTIDIYNREIKEILDKIIIANYNEDNLSIIPSCQCGEIKGAYYIGTLCSKCNTQVSPTIEDNLSFLLWVKRVREVERFISPIVIKMLSRRYKISKPNIPIIPYLMISNYQIDKKQQKGNLEHIEKLNFLLEERGIKRGYNSFVQNFFAIIDILETHFKNKDHVSNFDFREFLWNNQNNIFSDYLPFPNKVVFAMESNELGKFFDDTLVKPINVIRKLTGIDLYNKPSYQKQNKVAKSLIELADFYEIYFKKVFFSKSGLIRQHISSTRSHFTARAVITSHYGIHNYDEIYLPWSLACTLFREHLLKLLLRDGFTYKNAISFLMYHNRIYHPKIEEYFNRIIYESGDGVRAFFNRNPSLHRGSIQVVRITKVKTDTNDNTISMSYLIAPSFNADFDGDELNLTLVLTQSVAQHMHNFESHHNVLGLTGPNEFTNNIKFPKTIVGTLSNWFSKD